MTTIEMILAGLIIILFVLRNWDRDLHTLQIRTMQDQLNARERDCSDLYYTTHSLTRAIIKRTEEKTDA